MMCYRIGDTGWVVIVDDFHDAEYALKIIQMITSGTDIHNLVSGLTRIPIPLNLITVDIDPPVLVMVSDGTMIPLVGSPGRLSVHTTYNPATRRQALLSKAFEWIDI